MSVYSFNSFGNISVQSIPQNNTFRLIPLPWPNNALEGFLSERIINLLYDGYYTNEVDIMNSFAQQYPELRSMSLENIIMTYTGRIRDTAAEILNHEFFMRCLSPQGGVPSGRLYQTILQQFKSFDNFLLQFTDRAVNHFGSGWVWLVFDPNSTFLMIVDGINAYNPIMDGYIPLLCLDVWEHAYLLDYGFDKRAYVNKFWKYVNWTYMEEIASDAIFGYRVRVQ